MLASALLAVALLAQHPAPKQSAQTADRIVILKSQHRMELWRGTKLLHSYSIALSQDKRGTKSAKGDHKTPEGTYFVDYRNAHSRFHKALHLSYPNSRDRALAASMRNPQARTSRSTES